jgi:hypothetical protein
MTRPNAIAFGSGYATLAIADDYYGIRLIETTLLKEGNYVRIDDGNQFPQLCKGGKRLGNTLIYHDEETLARDCNARIIKTANGWLKATAKMRAEAA